jgi:hypothetical protein
MSSFDNAQTLLALSDALREVYHPDVEELHQRWGDPINRLIRMSNRRIDGDGITIQVQDRVSGAARYGRDLNGAFPTPDPLGFKKYKVTLSEDPTENDFARLATSVSVSDLDLERVTSKGAAAVEDYVKKYFDDAVKDVAESRVKHEHIGRDAKLGVVNGTPASNDRRRFDECASIAATGGARVRVDGGPIAFFRRGMRLDVYSSAGTKRFSVEVTDVNVRDLSVGMYGINASGQASSSVDLSAMADNDELYLTGEKDKGPVTLASWLTPPAGSGDDFFGKDREDPDYRWMQPHYSGPSSAEAFDLRHVDSAAIELAYLSPSDDDARVTMARPELIQTYEDLVGADKIIQFPTSEQRGRLLAIHGFEGAIYRHAKLGRVMFKANPLMPEHTIWMLRPGDWEMLNAFGDKFHWMPGLRGFYYRLNADEPGTGWGTVWKADGYGVQATVCLRPGDQIVIENVTPTIGVSMS